MAKNRLEIPTIYWLISLAFLTFSVQWLFGWQSGGEASSASTNPRAAKGAGKDHQKKASWFRHRLEIPCQSKGIGAIRPDSNRIPSRLQILQKQVLNVVDRTVALRDQGAKKTIGRSIKTQSHIGKSK